MVISLAEFERYRSQLALAKSRAFATRVAAIQEEHTILFCERFILRQDHDRLQKQLTSLKLKESRLSEDLEIIQVLGARIEYIEQRMLKIRVDTCYYIPNDVLTELLVRKRC